MAITLTTSLDGKWRKSGEKEREREREREKESRGILSSPRLLKTYTEMITSATTVSGSCVIYLRIPISTSLALMFLLPNVIALGFLYVVISRKANSFLILIFKDTHDDVSVQILSSKTNIIYRINHTLRVRDSPKFILQPSQFLILDLLFLNVTNTRAFHRK